MLDKYGWLESGAGTPHLDRNANGENYMQAPPVNEIDFETEAIQRRPNYPPKPVGVAIRRIGERKRRYYSWGHPLNNNCTKAEAEAVLKDIWNSSEPMLFHNAKFDVDVASVHMNGCERLPAWDRVHDTMFLLFLHDPYSALSLKPAATRILDMPPEEQDDVRDWLLDHDVVKRNQREWGAFIAKAPGDLVGRYAVGDIERTRRLFDKLYPLISADSPQVPFMQSMLDAYNRERRLMPILLDTERDGLRVDLERMEKDWIIYTAALEKADNWLRKKLHEPDLNLDADLDLGEVLDREGIVKDWVWTPGGKNKARQRSVSKKNLGIDKFRDHKIALVYAYRVRLQTCLSTFFSPWLAMARESDGWIFTNWNQVRQTHGEDPAGTRTGRLSSNPNFQNVPKDFEDKDDGFKFEPWMATLGLPPLPLMRKYILPDDNCYWLHRDYNQQELRMLAHFEGGALCKRYNDEPRFDIHTAVQKGIEEILGIKLTRSGTKIVNFADLYGRGLAQVAINLHTDMKTAQRVRTTQRSLLPGVAELTANVKERGHAGLPIRTWGGRLYYCEPAGWSKKHNRFMSYEYKLLNYLIQGSSGDVTKEAVCRYAVHPKRRSKFKITVHDEINSSSPSLKGLSEKAKRSLILEEMEIKRDVMASVEVDVPMLSDGKVGPNWGTLTKWED